MEFDDLLKIIGQFGNYQKFLYFLLCFFAASAALIQISIVFITATPDHWCSSPELDHLNLSHDVLLNLTIPEEDGIYSQCEMYDRNYSGWTSGDVDQCLHDWWTCNASSTACRSGWSYDHSQYVSTISTQFDLVCDRRWLRAAASSCYMGGFILGSLIFGSLADRYGRKRTFIVAYIVNVLLNIGLAFSPDIATFLTLRFFGAIFDQFYYTGFVVGMELVGPSVRGHTGVIFVYFWSFGYMITSLLAYFIRDWAKLQFIIALTLLVYVPYYWLIPESPRWYYATDHQKQGNRVMETIARHNKTSLPDPLNVTVKGDPKGFIWDVLRVPWIRKCFLILSLNAFANGLLYYGLSLNTPTFSTNDYLSVLIAGAVEFPANIICHICLQYFNRKWPYFIALLTAGLCMLATVPVPPDWYEVLMVFTMLGKATVTMSFTIVGILICEMLPTVVRKSGCSAVTAIGTIGSMISPYIALLYEIVPYLPALIFGILAVTAALFSLLLPETKEIDLPETLQDGEKLKWKQSADARDSSQVNSTPPNDTSEVNRGYQEEINENIHPDADTVEHHGNYLTRL